MAARPAYQCARGGGQPGDGQRPLRGIDGFHPSPIATLRQAAGLGVRNPRRIGKPNWGCGSNCSMTAVAATFVTSARTPLPAKTGGLACSFCRAGRRAGLDELGELLFQTDRPAAAPGCLKTLAATCCRARAGQRWWMCFRAVPDPAADPGPSMASCALGAAGAGNWSRRRRALAQLRAAAVGRLFRGPRGGGPKTKTPMRLSAAACAQALPPGHQPGPWPTAVTRLPLEIWGASPSRPAFLGAVDAWSGRQRPPNCAGMARRVVTARLAGAA